MIHILPRNLEWLSCPWNGTPEMNFGDQVTGVEPKTNVIN